MQGDSAVPDPDRARLDCPAVPADVIAGEACEMTGAPRAGREDDRAQQLGDHGVVAGDLARGTGRTLGPRRSDWTLGPGRTLWTCDRSHAGPGQRDRSRA